MQSCGDQWVDECITRCAILTAYVADKHICIQFHSVEYFVIKSYSQFHSIPNQLNPTQSNLPQLNPTNTPAL